MSKADTLFEGSIPRIKVAQTCVESLFYDNTNHKVIEIATKTEGVEQNWAELFANIN